MRPLPGWLAYTTPSGERAMKRTPSTPFAKYVTARPAGTLSLPSSVEVRAVVSPPEVGDDGDVDDASPDPEPHEAPTVTPSTSISPSGPVKREPSARECLMLLLPPRLQRPKNLPR